jgi:hypothetical protein
MTHEAARRYSYAEYPNRRGVANVPPVLYATLTGSGSPDQTEWDSLLAHALAAPTRDHEDHLTPLEPERDHTRTITRADEVLEKLHGHAQRLRDSGQVGDLELELSVALAQNVQVGSSRSSVRDHAWLARLGLDISYLWLEDFITALLTGAPFVDIETVGPYASHHVDEEGRLTVLADNLSVDERAGILIAAVLRDVLSSCSNVRIVALLDDFSEIDGEALSDDDRYRYIIEMGKLLLDHGVLRGDDIPGQDYLLLQESSYQAKVDELIEKLSHSGRGVVEHHPNGDVIFRPSATLIEQLALHSRDRIREFRRRGILIKKAGRATCQALESASFLHPTNKHIMHVLMLDRKFASQQDKTYALLRALDIAWLDSHHNLFYDTSKLSPEAIAFAICELLIRELKQITTHLKRLEDWESVEVGSYQDHVDALPSDTVTEIAAFMSTKLSTWDRPLAIDATDVGAGSSLLPALLLTPYVAKDGKISLIEYAGRDRVVLSEDLQDIWQNWRVTPLARLERELTQRHYEYAGATSRLPDLCRVNPGSICTLEADAYDLASSFFAAESLATSRREICLAVRCLARSLRPGGMLITTHTLASEPDQPDGDRRFPARSLTRRDIHEAYLDAELEFSMHVIDDTTPSGSMGQVAVVIARRPLLLTGDPCC